MDEFNGTVETTFFGFHRVNVDLLLTNDTIVQEHIVSLKGDIIYFDLSNCDKPDRDLGAILHYSGVTFVCLVAVCFQLSLVLPLKRLAKFRGPSFYILLCLLFCTCSNIIFFELLLYLEAAVGFRFPIPFDLDYYIRMLQGRGETVFYFIYTANRCACLLFPFRYGSMFSKRNVFWLIAWGWMYCILEKSEWLLANKGINRVHCLAPGGELNGKFQSYEVVMDPLMVVIEKVSEYLYYILWYGPFVMDIFTLGKLFHEKYSLRTVKPWIVARPAMTNRAQLSETNERIRLFMVCVCTSTYHFIFGYLFAYTWEIDSVTIYNLLNILDMSIPFLLMMWISRDVRKEWKLKNNVIWPKTSTNTETVFSRTVKNSIHIQSY
ncbi:hypothetical protein Ddc_12668 [Ditylenchus destructor]|nr:hypothetical protein Ddc_12668 [Ditylenchus destructor]